MDEIVLPDYLNDTRYASRLGSVSIQNVGGEQYILIKHSCKYSEFNFASI
jgi:hypothetical protein